MVGAEQALEIDRTKLELSPVRNLESRNPGRLLVLVWLNGRECEEGVVHVLNRSCDEPVWESFSRKIHRALRGGRDGPRCGGINEDTRQDPGSLCR